MQPALVSGAQISELSEQDVVPYASNHSSNTALSGTNLGDQLFVSHPVIHTSINYIKSILDNSFSSKQEQYEKQ
jgi:hypothetical protein